MAFSPIVAFHTKNSLVLAELSGKTQSSELTKQDSSEKLLQCLEGVSW